MLRRMDSSARHAPKLGANTTLDTKMLRRSIALVTEQSRMGMLTVWLVTAALAGMFVPAVGWPRYLTWAVPVAAGFALRQFWFERLMRDPERTSRLQLTLITSASAFTGWLVMLCLPVFGPDLQEQQVVFLSALMLAWVAAAVSVLGVQPRVYGVYLVACLSTILLSLWPRYTALEWALMVLGVAFGGAMMFRLSKNIQQLLNEAVADRMESDELASQLDQALDDQQSVFETRARFLAAASHDLKQPVQALTLLVSVLRRSESEERRRQVVEEIAQATSSIESMFSGLLDMASIDAGSMIAHICPVEMAPLFRSVLAGYPQRCSQKGLRFSLRVQDPPAVLADTLLLQRVLNNLLDNACKYCVSGSVSLEAVVRDHHLLVTISDSGIGLDAGELAHLYQAFVRGSSAKALGIPGLGLGLATARYMTELMGARLEILSKKDQGTTARLWLPLAQEAATKMQQEAHRPALAGTHIMVLEDDPSARTAMTYWLQDAGATVTAASNGSDLWRQLEPGSVPSLVLADFNLGPGNDNGVAVVHQLRQRFPNVHVLIVTGESDAGPTPQDFKVLKKPVSAQTLTTALNQVLNPKEGP
jgi:two-component system, sensor histidine kinase